VGILAAKVIRLWGWLKLFGDQREPEVFLASALEFKLVSSNAVPFCLNFRFIRLRLSRSKLGSFRQRIQLSMLYSGRSSCISIFSGVQPGSDFTSKSNFGEQDVPVPGSIRTGCQHRWTKNSPAANTE
jgi:hypothetical protein